MPLANAIRTTLSPDLAIDLGTANTVIYERGKRNWSAYVPDLPGCIATAKNKKQLERRIRESIVFHIEGMNLHGEQVPEPSILAGTVSVKS